MGDGPLRIAGIASHNGTNLRHIDAAGRAGTLDAELVVLVSNNGDATILDYARRPRHRLVPPEQPHPSRPGRRSTGPSPTSWPTTASTWCSCPGT